MPPVPSPSPSRPSIPDNPVGDAGAGAGWHRPEPRLWCAFAKYFRGPDGSLRTTEEFR